MIVLNKPDFHILYFSVNFLWMAFLHTMRERTEVNNIFGSGTENMAYNLHLLQQYWVWFVARANLKKSATHLSEIKVCMTALTCCSQMYWAERCRYKQNCKNITHFVLWMLLAVTVGKKNPKPTQLVMWIVSCKQRELRKKKKKTGERRNIPEDLNWGV